MSASIIGNSQNGNVPMAQNGRQFQWGEIVFSTTDATGTIPVLNMGQVETVILTAIGAPAGEQVQINFGQLGTISATASFSMRAPKTGTVTAASFTVSTTVATDAANIWTVGIVNKGAAGSGSAKIVDAATAANSNNATGGAAFTANVPRALTLGAAADLEVTAGDVLVITFTKAASASNLVGTIADLRETTAGSDEILYWADSPNTSGHFSLTSSDPKITIGRKGYSKTSALKAGYLVIGR